MLLILFVSMEEVIDLATVFYLFFLPWKGKGLDVFKDKVAP